MGLPFQCHLNHPQGSQFTDLPPTDFGASSSRYVFFTSCIYLFSLLYLLCVFSLFSVVSLIAVSFSILSVVSLLSVVSFSLLSVVSLSLLSVVSHPQTRKPANPQTRNPMTRLPFPAKSELCSNCSYARQSLDVLARRIERE